VTLIENGFDDNGEIVVPQSGRAALAPLVKQIETINKHLVEIDAELAAVAKADEKATRLMRSPA
jgi:hypothetical protein